MDTRVRHRQVQIGTVDTFYREAGPIRRTQDNLRAPMFEEHIAATLNKRAFNRGNAEMKEAAAVFQNLGGMQREALQMSADEARRRAAERSR
jgi:hypothetical protein